MNRLDKEIRLLAQQERELLCTLLPKIREMDLSQGYLDLGFSSLFAYLTVGVGYSEGSAQRRIDAARLLKEVPSLAEKLESGAIKLSQVSLVKKAVRQTTRKVAAEEKCELFASLEGMNSRESEKAVAQFFDLPVIEQTRKTTQADESVRLEVTLSKELAAKIQRAQELLSHQVPSNQFIDYLEYVTNKVIESKTPKSPSTATAAVTPKRRLEILAEQPGCAHVDSRTGQRCGSQWQSQVDHKQPRWAGGSHEPGNLQNLCAKHNRQKYRREIGLR